MRNRGALGGLSNWSGELDTDQRWDSNTPDAKHFIENAESEGVHAAITGRDGPFADYSQAPPERKPRPDNVIDPTRGRAAKA